MTFVHLYIAGWTRSGTTLLGGLLGAVDGWTNVGELRYVWDRGHVEDHVCACGRTFSDCPFWGEVAHPSHERAAELARVRDRYLRTAATFPALALERTMPAALRDYRDANEALLGRVAAHTGARVIVDSSKSALDALLLGSTSAREMRVVHIVRDPRAVAFSLSAEKFDPGSGGHFPRKSPWLSSARWLERNALVEVALARRVPVHRIRYEDLATRPAETLNAALAALGFDERVSEESPGVMRSDAAHAISGNPARFASGTVTLRPDDRWLEGLSPADRRRAALPAAPLMRRYGYR